MGAESNPLACSPLGPDCTAMRIAELLEVVEPAAGISREEADRAIRATASFSLDEFVRRVAQREGTDRETAYEVALAWARPRGRVCDP